MTENQHKSALSKILRLKEVFFINASALIRGYPDLLIVLYSRRLRVLGVELKLEYNRPTELQLLNLERLTKSGGQGFVIYYMNDDSITIEEYGTTTSSWRVIRHSIIPKHDFEAEFPYNLLD